MVNSDAEGYKLSDTRDRVNDPYVKFSNKKTLVTPFKGTRFLAKLIDVTPTEFVFEGEARTISIYQRHAIKSMILPARER